MAGIVHGRRFAIVAGILGVFAIQGSGASVSLPNEVACGIGAVCVGVLAGIVSWTSTVKRLHDFNLSGWYYLLIAIAQAIFATIYPRIDGLLSLAVFVTFYCIPGKDGPNRYGPDPRAGRVPTEQTLSTLV